MHEDTCRFVSEFLWTIKTEHASMGLRKLEEKLLGHIETMPGVAGVLLLSAWPQGKPQSVVCSNAWTPQDLMNQKQLRALARRFSGLETTEHHRRRLDDDDDLRWLASNLVDQDPTFFTFVPLWAFVQPEFEKSPMFRRVLVVAFADVDEFAKEEPKGRDPSDLEFLGWLITQLVVNWECPRIARRYNTLAHTFDHAVPQVLGEVPALDGGQKEYFEQLVQSIQKLMGCDTCQLYLLPSDARNDHTTSSGRIELVAEQVANREGLRYMRSDEALIPDLWKKGQMEPLSVANMVTDPEYGKYALCRFGLTRNFIGMAVGRRDASAPLGVIALRDKYKVGKEDGLERIWPEGFSPNDKEKLKDLVEKNLIGPLKDGGWKTGSPPDRKAVQKAVDHICTELYADNCLLYLTPRAMGVNKVGQEDYVELYCHSRHNWVGQASYVEGKGLTGRAFAGELINEPDILLLLTSNEASEQLPLGLYRLSQHVLAVPIYAPPRLDGRQAEKKIIGVLKVRDRLHPDQKTLNNRGFAKEDQHLLKAFADMISVNMAMREYLQQIRAAWADQIAGVAGGYQHDFDNLLKTIILNFEDIDKHDEIPEGLRNIARVLVPESEKLRAMIDRSLVGAKVARGTYAGLSGERCDVADVLNEFFPPGKPEDGRYLSPRQECEANVSMTVGDNPRQPLVVYCDRKLIELAILVLPVLVYHLAGVRRDRLEPAIQVSISTKKGARHVLLRILVAASLNGPIDQSNDDVVTGRHIRYTNLLVCPVVPWAAFANAFKYYGARLRSKHLEGRTTRIEIELEAVPGKGESGAPP